MTAPPPDPGHLLLGTAIVAAYVASLVVLAVVFWTRGFPAFAVAVGILAAEVVRQTVQAWRRWP
jgi:hypothetical protein